MDEKDITVVRVHKDSNPADALTKYLAQEGIQRQIGMVGSQYASGRHPIMPEVGIGAVAERPYDQDSSQDSTHGGVTLGSLVPCMRDCSSFQVLRSTPQDRSGPGSVGCSPNRSCICRGSGGFVRGPVGWSHSRRARIPSKTIGKHGVFGALLSEP